MTAEMGKETLEIPVPTDKVLLFDLDKTLIDASYNITDPRIFAEIKRLQDLGWILGLSSDTPVKAMEKWKEEFGMNGPLIAERGALIQLPDDREIELVAHSKEFFGMLRDEAVSYAVQENIPFYFGDGVAFLRSGPTIEGLVDNRLLLFNAYRRCSIGVWGRRIDAQGRLSLDNQLIRDLSSRLQTETANPPFELETDMNEEYGILILSPKIVNKRMATQRLMEELGLAKVGMVGDSKTDIVESDIAVHYAVGNAKSELVSIADYKADANYTEGVVEILSKIK